MNVSSLISRFHLEAHPLPPQTAAPSRRTAAIAALVAGAAALTATLTGRASWTLLAACYLAWCYSGWVLYFAGRAAQGRLRLLELLLVLTGIVAALTLAADLYMRALGPSWKL